MGNTDYQSGHCVGGDMNGVWGEGILENMTTYGVSLGHGASASADYRYARTGTVVDTRAGERSTNNIVRRIHSPILYGRINITSMNTDMRWFFGFADITDIPVNTDIPLANANGWGIIVDDNAGNNALDFQVNNGAATPTEVNIISSTTGLADFDNGWLYYMIDCNERADTFTYKIWNTADGEPEPPQTPTYSGTVTFASQQTPSTTTSFRYHNVICNDSTVEVTIHIAQVHILSRPSFDHLSYNW